MLEVRHAVVPMIGPGGCIDPGGEFVDEPVSPNFKALIYGYRVGEAMPDLTVDAKVEVERSVHLEEEHVRFYSSVISHIAVLTISHGNQDSFRRWNVVADVGLDDVWAAVDGRVKRIMSDTNGFMEIAYAPVHHLTSVFYRHKSLGESTPG